MLVLALHLTLAATPSGVHLLPPAPEPVFVARETGLSAPPIVSFDGEPSRATLAVGQELVELTQRVRALTKKIRQLGPNWPVLPTALVCLGLFAAYEGFILVVSPSLFAVAIIYYTVVLAVLGVGVYWGYASWVSNGEERAALIKERDALQRRLDDASLAPSGAPVPSVQATPRPTLLLARF